MIVLAGEEFTTKKSAGDRVRAILHATPFHTPITGRNHDVCRDLVDRHPRAIEKLGVGVMWFEVRPNPMYPGQRSFWLVRTDGSETDWSYLQCLTPTSHRGYCLEAMRVAVIDQVLAFKNAAFAGGEVRCAVTDAVVGPDECHIDHAPPIFLSLAEEFAQRFGGFERLMVSNGTDGDIGRRLIDAQQCAAWQDFHARNASLRVVTREANLSLLRRGRGDVS